MNALRELFRVATHTVNPSYFLVLSEVFDIPKDHFTVHTIHFHPMLSLFLNTYTEDITYSSNVSGTRKCHSSSQNHSLQWYSNEGTQFSRPHYAMLWWQKKWLSFTVYTIFPFMYHVMYNFYLLVHASCSYRARKLRLCLNVTVYVYYGLFPNYFAAIKQNVN